MISLIGRRTVFYKDNGGEIRPIQITVSYSDAESERLRNGKSIPQYNGTCTITSDHFNRQMKIGGDDELQMIYRCLWLSDLWLRTTCEEAGVVLFTIDSDQPVDEAFGSYS